ncbi:MAG: hypothetical protein L0G87_04655, partial [Renibacterium salmoninarum]|nr:hypothetical protein [Renibacterium salmoninarum]
MPGKHVRYTAAKAKPQVISKDKVTIGAAAVLVSGAMLMGPVATVAQASTVDGTSVQGQASGQGDVV